MIFSHIDGKLRPYKNTNTSQLPHKILSQTVSNGVKRNETAKKKSPEIP
jgi:hypothetical protein